MKGDGALLIGEKVVLRPHTRDDLPLVWKFRTDVEVELASGGDPPRPLMFQQIEGEFERQEFIFKEGFAIEADGRYIGFCGIFGFHPTAHRCELGITIGDKEHWGRGYGRDAVRLLLDYAFRLRNVRRVWLTTHAANERALRCYRACGFLEEGRLRQHAWSDGGYVDVITMGILREEWESEPTRSG